MVDVEPEDKRAAEQTLLIARGVKKSDKEFINHVSIILNRAVS